MSGGEAATCIAILDDALREYGQDVVLQRLISNDAGEQAIANSADCRAAVRAHGPQALDAMIEEAPPTSVVLSPTDLTAAVWPGLPAKDDRLIIAGRPNNVETVSPIELDGALVRIDLTCRE